MKLKSHIIITFGISSILYLIYNSFCMFISSFIGGVLIDLDHLVDYYFHNGINFRVRRFFTWCYNLQWNKVIILLHSLELIFALWVVISVFNLGPLWLGLAIVISQHLILDMLFNNETVNVFS